MRKIFLTFMMFFVMSSVALAGDVRFESISSYVESYDYGYDLFTSVNIDTDLGFDPTDSKVRVMVPELGLYFSSSLRDVEDDEEISRMIVGEIPYQVEPGYYMVRIVVSGDGFSSIRHREVYIG